VDVVWRSCGATLRSVEDMTTRTHATKAGRTTRQLLVALAALLAVVGLALTGFSSASFTASSASTGSVRASSDWTPPTVAMQAPTSPLRDTATLAATANDGESALQSVTIRYQPASGGAWVTACTDTTAPYTCAWSTKAVADGAYLLSAVAVDGAGHSTLSDSVRATVANTVDVTLATPADQLRGSVPLSATIQNGGTASYTVRTEYSLAGANSWKTLCTMSGAPSYGCTWATTTYANDTYDLRVVAVTGGTTYYSPVVADISVDNLAPAVTMTDPGTPLSGTRTFAATATDADSGVEQVVIQYAKSGTTTYATLCTVSAEPFSCRYDTTKLAGGSYSFRAIATDAAGNSTTSAVVSNRVVDNTVSSVSIDDPGAFLTGTVTLDANASSTAGVASVRIQRATTGSSTWTDVCTDTTSPYSCDWVTGSVANGSYDLRAVLTDGGGRTTTSAVVSARIVDNTPLRGIDIQATNGGKAAQIDAGDKLTYTFNAPVDLATISSGWTGTQVPVTVRLRDGGLSFGGTTADTLDVSRNGATVNLGTVQLKGDFVRVLRTATLDATMTAGTVTVNGVPRTTVTLTMGAVDSGSTAIRTSSSTAAMVWSPSSSVLDLNGHRSSTAQVTESGPLDKDF
jgi:hypothetical protein